ncbi:hypothetical protein PSE_1318 [Pseudovibrio sp. FO-BEG1]|nr:hypothetical protein PSE_1318 [Pseudovibrio sp. FO-BEG1]
MNQEVSAKPADLLKGEERRSTKPLSTHATFLQNCDIVKPFYHIG